MGRTADTLRILADGDTTVFAIKSIETVYSGTSALPVRESSTTQDTATGLVFNLRGRREQFVKDARGELVRVDRRVFFMPSATVQVGYRLEHAGDNEYDEVVSVYRYSDHLEVLTREVTGR